MKQQDFIEKISACVVRDMEASDILASVTIAQAILESSWGSSELTTMANNLFGMKCFLSGNTWNSAWDGVSKYSIITKEQDKDGNESRVLANFRRYESWETSINDHSLYLLGAMKGKELRFKGLAGEKDPRKAIQIIKDGGYATDVKYVDKVMSIIDKYDLTQYDRQNTTNKEDNRVEIKESIAILNPCYKAGKKITVKGLMLHSVGCPQPDPNVFVKLWNSSTAKVGVHAVVGNSGIVYKTLPFDCRAWHCGGAGNNSYLSLEMTEPASIKYTSGSAWIETGNGENTKAHVLSTYKYAAEFFAEMCKEYNLNPLTDIISHHEGCLLGIASNHGDVEHIWNKFGLTMDKFRADVKALMTSSAPVISVPDKPIKVTSDDTSAQEVTPLRGTVTVGYRGSDGLNLRRFPSITATVDRVVHAGEQFHVTGISKDEKWYQLSVGADYNVYVSTSPSYVTFRATVEQKVSTEGTGYYRVRKSWKSASSQIAAFKDKENAIELCKQNSGYKVFDNNGIEIYPCNIVYPQVPFRFKVTTEDLRIRKSAGTTYDYHKKDGKPVYTGEGTFTIVKTKEGQGAKMWGLLKTYEKTKDGWIALDKEYGQIINDLAKKN